MMKIKHSIYREIILLFDGYQKYLDKGNSINLFQLFSLIIERRGTMPKLSVIIPTFNRSKYLDLTLAAFTIQSFIDFELIIIDDGSHDNTKEIVDMYSEKITIKYLYQDHQGLAAARNLALETCTGEYIVNIDSDRIPSPHFLESHYEFMKENPKTVSVGLKPLVLTFFTQDLNLNYSSLFKFLRNNPGYTQDFIQKAEFPLIDCDQLVGNFEAAMNNLYLRLPRDNYQEIMEEHTDYLSGFDLGWAIATGGNVAYEFNQARDLRFDLNYKGWGLEDTDFAYQLHLEGYKFYFNRKAVNFHQIHPRSATESTELWANFNYFCEKFNNPEILLFKQVFRNNISLKEANQILRKLGGVSEKWFCDYKNLLNKY